MKPLSIALFAATLIAAPAYAQTFDPTIFGTNYAIQFSPAYPAPGDSVHLTLTGSGDIANSSIIWHAQGKVIAQGIGADTADIIAPALGRSVQIEADVQDAGSAYVAQAQLAPTQTDLLVESDSYTPPFYRGRALPSAGTNVIARALTRFVRADGSVIPDTQITYTWKLDGEVQGSLSGRGRSTVVIPIAHLYSANQLSVDAVSADGSREGGASVQARSVTPVLDLYEDHPLYGILFNNAMGATNSIGDSEMTFAAIPYFASVSSPGDSALAYAWQVNGSRIASSTSSPDEITINADNSNGQAQVSLELTHATNYFLDASNRWQIAFSSVSASQNPFNVGQ